LVELFKEGTALSTDCHGSFVWVEGTNEGKSEVNFFDDEYMCEGEVEENFVGDEDS